MRKILTTIVMMTLTACGGGDGGSASDGSTEAEGSATFENLFLGSSGTQCIKNNAMLLNYSAPPNSVACSNAGGVWHPTNMVTTAEICRLNGVDFYTEGGGTATSSHQNACYNVGGSFIASTTENILRRHSVFEFR